MFRNRQPNSPEHQSNPEADILGIIRGLEPRLLMTGTAQIEDAHDRGRYVPATGIDYDVVGGVIEVDEIDPNRSPTDGRYPNMRYTALIYNANTADKLDGKRASFSRSLGMVDGNRRTVNYDVLSDGSIAKSCTDFDGKNYRGVAGVEFPEGEELAFLQQMDSIVTVEDLPHSR